jgi:hypothetical protein
MDRGKRASMREGPLSALFRSTEELDLPAEEPRSEAAPVEPPRVDPAPVERPRPAPRVVEEPPREVRSYEQRLRHVFSNDIPDNMLEREPRPMYGRDEPRPVSTPQ